MPERHGDPQQDRRLATPDAEAERAALVAALLRILDEDFATLFALVDAAQQAALTAAFIAAERAVAEHGTADLQAAIAAVKPAAGALECAKAVHRQAAAMHAEATRLVDLAVGLAELEHRQTTHATTH